MGLKSGRAQLALSLRSHPSSTLFEVPRSSVTSMHCISGVQWLQHLPPFDWLRQSQRKLYLMRQEDRRAKASDPV